MKDTVLIQPPYRAVLFDYFGTLTRAVRQGPVHRWMAERLGCDPDAWLDLLTNTFYLRAAGSLGEPVDVIADMAASLGGRPGRRALRDVHAARVSAVAAEGPLRPDALPVLRAVRARGLRTALVSDCWYELPLLLPSVPVHPLFDTRVYSYTEGCCKPSARMYLNACARLDVRPQDCLYIGDGGSRELTGAAAVGMTAVRLGAPDLRAHLSYEPDRQWRGAVVGSLRALPRLLDGRPALV